MYSLLLKVEISVLNEDNIANPLFSCSGVLEINKISFINSPSSSFQTGLIKVLLGGFFFNI
jgi:hypothetical protein